MPTDVSKGQRGSVFLLPATRLRAVSVAYGQETLLLRMYQYGNFIYVPQ